MRWTRGERSRNIEDRRGQRAGLTAGGRGLGLGGLVLLLILSVVFKRDFFSLLGAGGDNPGGLNAGIPGQVDAGPVPSTPEEEKLVDFVSFVLDSAQAFWAEEFPRLGASYEPARLVLFRDAANSACGYAESATGPFYCPGDRRVYIDLGFYDELRQRFGAPGDFAQAYVLAHELGHHVQNLLGIERQVREAQQRDPSRRNELSVRMELQADCLAGVWGNRTRHQGILEPGDVEEGLRAAAAVGDDHIQKMSGSRVTPDAFTHGTSAQRQRWFTEGYQSGDVERCDTFGASRL